MTWPRVRSSNNRENRSSGSRDTDALSAHTEQQNSEFCDPEKAWVMPDGCGDGGMMGVLDAEPEGGKRWMPHKEEA